jgi:hypothetical protein
MALRGRASPANAVRYERPELCDQYRRSVSRGHVLGASPAMGGRSYQAVIIGQYAERIDRTLPLQEPSASLAKRELKKGRGLVPRPQTRPRICLCSVETTVWKSVRLLK